jgi:predicted transcriptional regulator
VRIVILSIYLDDATEKRLTKLAQEHECDMAELAECAVAESVLNAFRYRGDDPARLAAAREGVGR